MSHPHHLMWITDCLFSFSTWTCQIMDNHIWHCIYIIKCKWSSITLNDFTKCHTWASNPFYFRQSVTNCWRLWRQIIFKLVFPSNWLGMWSRFHRYILFVLSLPFEMNDCALISLLALRLTFTAYVSLFVKSHCFAFSHCFALSRMNKSQSNKNNGAVKQKQECSIAQRRGQSNKNKSTVNQKQKCSWT